MSDAAPESRACSEKESCVPSNKRLKHVTNVNIFLGSAVHSSNAADNKAKLSNFTGDYKDGDMYVLFAYYSYIEI